MISLLKKNGKVISVQIVAQTGVLVVCIERQSTRVFGDQTGVDVDSVTTLELIHRRL